MKFILLLAISGTISVAMREEFEQRPEGLSLSIPDVSSLLKFQNRRGLRAGAENIWSHRKKAREELESIKPPGRFLDFQRKVRDQKRGQIDWMNSSLREISQKVWELEEAERSKYGAKWEELRSIFQAVGLEVPDTFQLGMIDYSSEQGVFSRHFEQGEGITGNRRVTVYIDGRGVSFAGQTIYLHQPEYQESYFLKILKQAEAQESLRVDFIGSSIEFVNFNVDRYQAAFTAGGWQFSTVEAFEGDLTIAPGSMDRETVLAQLAKLK